MKKIFLVILFLQLLFLYSVTDAQAPRECSITGVSHINFGNVLLSSLLTSPLDTVGSVTVECRPAEQDIEISLSTGQSGNCNQRTMQSQGAYINYNLYTDSARTNVWGDITCGSTVRIRSNPQGQTVYIYGRIPQGQDVAVGSYSDNITITATWIDRGVVKTTTAPLNVSANVLPECKFKTQQTAINVTLDPSMSNVISNGNLQFWCTKETNYSITDDDGLHKAGTTHRVKHSTLNEYIPYKFNYPLSGIGNGPRNPINLNITVEFSATDYQNAPAGTYTDTVTVTISP